MAGPSQPNQLSNIFEFTAGPSQPRELSNMFQFTAGPSQPTELNNVSGEHAFTFNLNDLNDPLDGIISGTERRWTPTPTPFPDRKSRNSNTKLLEPFQKTKNTDIYESVLKHMHNKGTEDGRGVILFGDADGPETHYEALKHDTEISVRRNETYLSIKLLAMLPQAFSPRVHVHEIPREYGRNIVGASIYGNNTLFEDKFWALVVKVKHDEAFPRGQLWKWQGELGAGQKVGVVVDNIAVTIEVRGLASGKRTVRSTLLRQNELVPYPR